MSLDENIPIWVVTFKWSENGPYCTNLVHARCSANIDREYDKYPWYDMRWARDYEIAPARAKGMPEVWC